MKIKPLFDRVLVKLIKEETKKTASGLILPENASERPLMAKVVEVGPGIEGKDKTEMILEIDDVVIFHKYAGVEFKFEDDSYVIIKQQDALAKIK